MTGVRPTGVATLDILIKDQPQVPLAGTLRVPKIHPCR
jgi:hypothetical protein